MVMSDKPTSVIAHFFKGDSAKPWIEAGRGWAILPFKLLVDTNGALWGWEQIITGSDYDGGRRGWKPIDFEYWQHQFSPDIPSRYAFVLLSPSESLSIDYAGDSPELILNLNLGTGSGSGIDYDSRPLNDHMIRGAAQLIASSR